MWGLYVIEKNEKKKLLSVNLPTAVSSEDQDDDFMVDEPVSDSTEPPLDCVDINEDDDNLDEPSTTDVIDCEVVKNVKGNEIKSKKSVEFWIVALVIGALSAIFIPFLMFFVALATLKVM